MTYNVLGINPGHNGSAALTVDGELVYYLEEERLTRQKYDGNPFRTILDILSKWHVDEVVIGGTNCAKPELSWTSEEPNYALVRKFNKNVKFTDLRDEHHLSHSLTAFYNSGFDKAIVVVADGAGSFKVEQIEPDNFAEGYEAESVWVMEYPLSAKLLYKSYGVPRVKNEVWSFKFPYHNVLDFDDAITVTKTYEAATQYLGFGFIEAGKTMGLSSYGKEDPRLPELYKGNRGSRDVFLTFLPAGAIIDEKRNEIFRRDYNPLEWHKDPTKLSDIEKNLAWKIQNETQKIIARYIEFSVEATGIKNVCVVGGYGLNCVANYYFKKVLPDINIYNEPVSHDGGTAIGLAKFGWYNKLREKGEEAKIHPLKTLYLGPKYDLKDIEKTLENHSEKIKTKKVTYDDIAKLISEKNIVAMYQGQSEAGPRALGNRSILYDPTDPDGKDFVNTVKGREWFRPFAGTVLQEDANDWFDMAGMDESPFMMYAVNVAADKIDQIPSICHVDDTCRIQTVTEDQNKHYYNLIKSFKDITGVPILFNTSFNLAGDPLVETVEDALDTLYRSKMNYLYLPELGLLVEKSV
jgi:carbamoyltransferase